MNTNKEAIFIPLKREELLTFMARDLAITPQELEPDLGECLDRLLQTFNDLRVYPIVCHNMDDVSDAERLYLNEGPYSRHYDGDYTIEFREKQRHYRAAIRFRLHAAPDLVITAADSV